MQYAISRIINNKYLKFQILKNEKNYLQDEFKEEGKKHILHIRKNENYFPTFNYYNIFILALYNSFHFSSNGYNWIIILLFFSKYKFEGENYSSF
jgi:hypothetical protein